MIGASGNRQRSDEMPSSEAANFTGAGLVSLNSASCNGRSRFCSAIVHVSDGSKHALAYAIGEDTGIIGATWGVEWCVVGLDRNWAYNPACKMALP